MMILTMGGMKSDVAREEEGKGPATKPDGGVLIECERGEV